MQRSEESEKEVEEEEEEAHERKLDDQHKLGWLSLPVAVGSTTERALPNQAGRIQLCSLNLVIKSDRTKFFKLKKGAKKKKGL